MNLEEILKFYQPGIAAGRDIHILRHYSAFVVVSEGRVIHVTDPDMRYCPLANILYPGFRKIEGSDLNGLKTQIKETIEAKIKEYGQFTNRRQIVDSNISIPYGASEIMMYALQKGAVDAAVVVCDGAGTVITDNPEIVQGIGSRMNGLFFTSPIAGIRDRLAQHRCHFISEQGRINQIEGIEQAVRLGYKRIAVTVNGFKGEGLGEIRKLEIRHKITVCIFVICTTGVGQERIEEIKSYGDLVWSCGSREVRKQIGKDAIMQFSRAIPVFVLAEKGLSAAKTYFEGPEILSHFEKGEQLLVCDDCPGEKVKVGDFYTRICSAKLPACGKRSPIFQEEGAVCR